MPLTPHEAFKVGFLARCVRDGLTPEQIHDRVKTAADLFEKEAFLGSLIGAAGNAVKGMGGYALPLAIAAPPVLGGLGGYALAKATDVDDTDVEDIKGQEVLDEYRRQAERLRRLQAARAARTPERPNARPLI
jgi:hypothetical protein